MEREKWEERTGKLVVFWSYYVSLFKGRLCILWMDCLGCLAGGLYLREAEGRGGEVVDCGREVHSSILTSLTPNVTTQKSHKIISFHSYSLHHPSPQFLIYLYISSPIYIPSLLPILLLHNWLGISFVRFSFACIEFRKIPIYPLLLRGF